MSLEDVQNGPAGQPIPIDHVGVTGLRYPITVLDRADQDQQTVAVLSLSVGLPHHFRGTHMSRFIEALNEHRGEVTMRTLPLILDDLRRRLDADSAKVEVRFPYFMQQAAPASGAQGVMSYDCTFVGESTGSECDFILGVCIPVSTVCPCSRSISDYGAHNQRGYLSIEVRTRQDDAGRWEFVWIEELIAIAEESASGPVYSLLKREDERQVTMDSYDNPVFVEDMVRNVASRLDVDARVTWYRVRAENHESIHNHNAFAVIEKRR